MRFLLQRLKKSMKLSQGVLFPARVCAPDDAMIGQSPFLK